MAETHESAGFARRARRLLLAWVALIALMLCSLGSAYLRLEPWNAVVGLAIAALKSAIVLWLFMDLARAGALVRIVAATALATLVLLLGLTQVDYRTRRPAPAPLQPAQQLRTPSGALR